MEVFVISTCRDFVTASLASKNERFQVLLDYIAVALATKITCNISTNQLMIH